MMEKIEAEHRPWLEKLPRTGDAANLCPACNGKSGVKSTSANRAGLLIRYRVCENCNLCYKTVELLAFGNCVSLRDKEKRHEQSL